MIDHVLGYSTVVIPAYGRTYKTSSDAVEDWKAGRDFKIIGQYLGPYCSIRDVGTHIHGRVYIRWNKLDDVRVN